MRILTCSINFSPELTGIGKYSGEMAEWLADQGHEVRVVTGHPHYPQWAVQEGYTAWKFTKERRNATVPSGGLLQVYRCPLWVPRVPRAWKRVLHLLSFSISSLPVILGNVLWKPDVVLLVAPTLFCSPQVLLASRLSGAVAWLHVQDFELDAAFELKDFSSNRLRRWSGILEGVVIRAFERTSTISGKMLERLASKGANLSHSVLFPNWVDTSAIYPAGYPVPLRGELGISKDTVVALYSGSLGKKQGMHLLLDVSQRLAHREDIRFVFCVDGPKRDAFAQVAQQAGNVIVLPLQPASRLNELLNLADIHLLPQLASAADLVMPSKLTGMMASGRPVLATAEPETQVSTLLSGRGMVVPPGNTDAFVSALIRLSEDPDLRTRLGRKAREHATAYMDRNDVLKQFEAAMLDVRAQRSLKAFRKPALLAAKEAVRGQSVFAREDADTSK